MADNFLLEGLLDNQCNGHRTRDSANLCRNGNRISSGRGTGIGRRPGDCYTPASPTSHERGEHQGQAPNCSRFSNSWPAPHPQERGTKHTASHRARSISGSSLVVANRFWRRSGSRVSINRRALGTGATEPTLCPLGQPEKAIDYESLIEPWLAPYNYSAACQLQAPIGVVTTTRMKPLRWKNQIASPHYAIGQSPGVPGQNKSFLHNVGWMSGQKILRLPVDGEVLFLTSLFIELHGTWSINDTVLYG
jgi:hypothetical protein